MRATDGASSCRACRTRVTSSTMAKACAAAVQSASVLHKNLMRMASCGLPRGPASTAHCGASAAGSWQEVDAQENAFWPLHREKTRYTWTNDDADLPTRLMLSASKNVSRKWCW